MLDNKSYLNTQLRQDPHRQLVGKVGLWQIDFTCRISISLFEDNKRHQPLIDLFKDLKKGQRIWIEMDWFTTVHKNACIYINVKEGYDIKLPK